MIREWLDRCAAYLSRELEEMELKRLVREAKREAEVKRLIDNGGLPPHGYFPKVEESISYRAKKKIYTTALELLSRFC